MGKWLFLAASVLATPVAAQTVTPQSAPSSPAIQHQAPAPPIHNVIPRMPFDANIALRQRSRDRSRLADRLFANSPLYRDSYQQALQYGRCAARLNPEQTDELLAARANTTTETIQLRQLTGATRSCKPFAFGAPVIFFRGALAEAMYNRLPVGAVNRPALVTPTNIAAFRAGAAAGGARLVDDRRYTLIADCLVLQSPLAVDGVLRSRHGSAAELHALNKVLASAPGCSDVSRFPVAGGRSFLRSYLAESAYRWINFSPAGRTVASL